MLPKAFSTLILFGGALVGWGVETGRYIEPKLPREDLALISSGWSRVHVVGVDGLSVHSIWETDMDRGRRNVALMPGIHQLVVQWQDSTNDYRYRGEATSLLVDVKKGHQYIIVPAFFLNGQEILQGLDTLPWRKQAYAEFHHPGTAEIDRYELN